MNRKEIEKRLTKISFMYYDDDNEQADAIMEAVCKLLDDMV